MDPQGATFYFTLLYLNTHNYTLDDARVRAALASAIDRDSLVREISGFALNPTPATTLVHPTIMGLDLYGQVGIPFDPEKAQALLAEAGYPDGVGFPTFNICSGSVWDEAILTPIMNAWVANLGIGTYMETHEDGCRYHQDNFHVFLQQWRNDYPDPDDTFSPFVSGSDINLTHYSNSVFDGVYEKARAISDQPSARQELYIQAERIITEQDIIVIPLFHDTTY
jgi:oligopeptide transport system substrate-binding protein